MHMNMHMHMHAVQRFPVTFLSAYVGLFCVIVGLFDLLIGLFDLRTCTCTPCRDSLSHSCLHT